jgi:hypothetical protein
VGSLDFKASGLLDPTVATLMRRLLLSLLAALWLPNMAQAQLPPQSSADAAARLWCQTFEQSSSWQRAATALYGRVPQLEDGSSLRLSDSFHTYHGHVRDCADNLKRLGAACERYSAHHQGAYPDRLEQLVPTYLAELPRCPAASRDTYSSSFQTGPQAEMNQEGQEDFYYICCQGDHHLGDALEPNSPGYSSLMGLLGLEGLERPATLEAPRAARTCQLLSIEMGADGRQAVARLQETVAADLDRDASSFHSSLLLRKTREGWVALHPLLSPEQHAYLDSLRQEQALQFLNLERPLFTPRPLSPAQALYTAVLLEQDPAYRILAGIPDLYQEAYRAGYRLDALGRRVHEFYQNTGRWPRQPGDLFGDQQLADDPPLRSLRFEPIEGGRAIDLIMPGPGFPSFGIPADYPLLRLTTSGEARVIYRPESR